MKTNTDNLITVTSMTTYTEYITEKCKEVNPKLWGEQYSAFKPRLCNKILGDGKQLIWFQTSDQRPYWWWVLIDSKTDTQNEGFNVLEIYDLIEEEFGSIPNENDEDYNEEIHGDVIKCYPMIVSNGGIQWGTQEYFINKQ